MSTAYKSIRQDFFFKDHDHAFAVMVQFEALKNHHVLFAAYDAPHPMQNDIILTITTDGQAQPVDCLNEAISSCHRQLADLEMALEIMA